MNWKARFSLLHTSICTSFPTIHYMHAWFDKELNQRTYVAVPQPGPLWLYTKLEGPSIVKLDFSFPQYAMWMIFKVKAISLFLKGTVNWRPHHILWYILDPRSLGVTVQLGPSWTSVPIPGKAIAHALLACITWYSSMPRTRVLPGKRERETHRESERRKASQQTHCMIAP